MSEERVTIGSLWDHNEDTHVRVQVKWVDYDLLNPLMTLKYLSGPREGNDVQFFIEYFVENWTKVDVFAKPLVNKGDRWRHNSWLTDSGDVWVRSVIDGVVTVQYVESPVYETSYSAYPLEYFVDTWSMIPVVTPLPPNIGGSADHLFIVAYADTVTGDVHWSVPAPSDAGVLRVPLDWENATWEVEPK